MPEGRLARARKTLPEGYQFKPRFRTGQPIEMTPAEANRYYDRQWAGVVKLAKETDAKKESPDEPRP